VNYFDEMCDHWLHKAILNKNKLTVEQKVIEVLAVYPGISLKELVEKTDSSEYEVKTCLMTFTLESYSQTYASFLNKIDRKFGYSLSDIYRE
jgi:hypothetical protein